MTKYYRASRDSGFNIIDLTHFEEARISSAFNSQLYHNRENENIYLSDHALIVISFNLFFLLQHILSSKPILVHKKTSKAES